MMVSNPYGTVHDMSMCREGALRAPFPSKSFSTYIVDGLKGDLIIRFNVLV